MSTRLEELSEKFQHLEDELLVEIQRKEKEPGLGKTRTRQDSTDHFLGKFAADHIGPIVIFKPDSKVIRMADVKTAFCIF